MKSIRLTFIFYFLAITSTFAHPGIGIVSDNSGNIYYTDLKQIWKITSNGKQSIAVPNVHSHELYMDAQNYLYGQDQQYSGEAANRFTNFVWRLSPSGKLDTIIQPKEGIYIEGFSFVHDTFGNLYWIQRLKEDIIYKRSPDGINRPLYQGKLKNVQWMHILNNNLYFIQDDDIYRLNEAEGLQVFASDLNRNRGNNTFFGLWSDKNNNLYVSNYQGRKVQQINSKGRITDYWTSSNEWAPIGGTFDINGQLWLLLVNAKNEVKVLKAFSNSQESKAANATAFRYLLLPLILIIIIVTHLFYRKQANVIK